jgi:vacuolar-type H+-ATPase subunit H
MTQDDFVTQILAAEESAKADVAKVKKKSQNDLTQYENSLVKHRETALEAQREKFREKLKERQAQAKAQYETAIKDGEREASQMKKEVMGKIDKQIPTAQAFFLNEIIA